MPVLPACLLEPLWVQFSALLPEHPVVSPTHPLGCHRPRIPDRVIFEHVIAALVHGSGYERIASPGCSDRTIRRRLHEWAAAGLAEQVQTLALQAYDRMIGLDLDELAVDGCLTKAPGGGEAAGRSPVDRGKQGLKRSIVTDGNGIPLHVVSAGANRHDSPLLGPTLGGLDKLRRAARGRDRLPGSGIRRPARRARCWTSSASTAPSRARACRPRSKLAPAGWSSARTAG